MLYHQLRGLFAAGIAAAAFCGAPALAADMPVKAPVYVAPFSWSGLYVGAHVGYGWGDYKFNEVGVLLQANTNPSGWLGGAQIGYNVQFAPNWMLGGEIDLSWADIRGSGAFPGTVLMAQGKVDSLGTARTRLGYIADRTMLYATGGLAWAHTKSQELAGGARVRDFDQSHFGWAIGGGLEYALDQRWSVKVEYLYADLGRNRDNLITAGGGELRQDLTINTVKAGVNYRFGAPAVYAADMPVKGYAPKTAPWSGSYLGLHGGYGWTDLEYQFGPALRLRPDPDGFFGGFQTGYNWRFAPNWLFGLETDTSFGNLSNTDNTTFPGVLSKGKIESFGTARARLGYVADRSLWYVTGGAAVAHVKIDFAIPGALTINRDSLHVGWTGGGGIEYAIDPLWSAKIEYLYADLGRNQERVVPFATDLTTNTVKFGVNYHGPLLERFFGGG